MKKKTKIIILTLMVVLLGVTGYLNIVLNNSVKETNTQVTTTSYFSSYKNDRQSTRDQELLYYDAIIDSASSSETAKKAAEDAKLDLMKKMEKEVVVEGLIRAQGYSDCVISITDNKINVVVKALSLTQNEVDKICAIIVDELKTQVRNIVIFSVQ